MPEGSIFHKKGGGFIIEYTLEEIKRAMHITDEYMDGELVSDIYSAFEDMQRVGVAAASGNINSRLVKKCVELYVKWQHDYLGQGEQYRKNYERLRDAMSQCSDYNTRRECGAEP